MKKRILSILLTLCMTLCLTPISVFAEEVGTEGSAAIQLGADALSVLSKNVNTATEISIVCRIFKPQLQCNVFI